LAMCISFVTLIGSICAWAFGPRIIHPPEGVGDLKRVFNELPTTSDQYETLKHAAEAVITSVIAQTGYNRYNYQPSALDGVTDNHELTHNWLEDVHSEEHHDNITDRDVQVFKDVVEYIRLNELLATRATPVLIYMFAPDSLSKHTETYDYRAMSKDYFEYRVRHGKTYKSKIWDFHGNEIAATKGRAFWQSTTIYTVYRRLVGEDRELVLLMPRMTFNPWGLAIQRRTSWLIRRMTGYCLGQTWRSFGLNIDFQTIPLDYLHIDEDNGFNRMKIKEGAELKICTGRNDAETTSKIQMHVDDTIRTMVTYGDVYMGQVSTYLSGDNVLAGPTYDYYKAKIKRRQPGLVVPAHLQILRYHLYPQLPCEPSKMTMRRFMNPIHLAAFVPNDCKSNTIHGIHNRLIKVKPGPLQFTPIITQSMREFIDYLIPVRNNLIPVDYQASLDRLKRPTQRFLHKMADWTFGKIRTLSFMKSESYGKVAPRRLISTINGADKIDYSRIIYAFETVLKRQPWYAFSKSPLSIAQRVADICKTANVVVASDFSKFDGHESEIFRKLEIRCMIAAFRVEHHDAVRELHERQYGLHGMTHDSVRYATDFSRLSGSPETSIFNSLNNAFTAYLASRIAGYDPFVSWKRLGIYGGDDGLTANISRESYIAAAEAVGQEITIKEVLRGVRGVQFLARVYSPFIWEGELSSMGGPKRQLGKFHVTHNNDFTNEQVFAAKIRSFSLTDWNSPVFNTFLARASELITEEKVIPQLSRWIDKFPREQQYPNEHHEWMYEQLIEEIPSFNLGAFTVCVAQCTTIAQLMNMPLFSEPEPIEVKEPTDVNGVLYPSTLQIDFVDPPIDEKGVLIEEDGKHHVEAPRTKFVNGYPRRPLNDLGCSLVQAPIVPNTKLWQPPKIRGARLPRVESKHDKPPDEDVAEMPAESKYLNRFGKIKKPSVQKLPPTLYGSGSVSSTAITMNKHAEQVDSARLLAKTPPVGVWRVKKQ